MKRSQTIRARLGALGASLAVLSCATVANAHPYASDITINNGVVQFYMNEKDAIVNVVFEDNTTNAMGTLPKGATNFVLGAHTSYKIIATKAGTGTPNLFTVDGNFWNAWSNPRGVDVNKNPKFGNRFGRVYVSHAGNTPGSSRQWGMYVVTPDFSTNAFPLMGTNAWAASTTTTGVFQPDCAAGNTSGPYRCTVAPDDSVFVTDFGTPGATVWQFGPDFEYTNMVLAPLGENQGIAAGTHGDPIGVAIEGSLATGDLKVYTSDPGFGAPAGMGGNYVQGGYNNIYRYDIGAGPMPLNQAPVWAVNLGLAGFADSQMLDLALGSDTTKVYGMFRRSNFSDGCIQVFDKASGTRLYTSVNASQTADIFQDAYAGVRISADGKYLATMTIGNVVRLVNLVNGLPDESSLITIANTPSTTNARGIAWDAADNIYTLSSGTAQLRGYSLGITSTAITANDWTGTNGTFQLILPDVTAGITAATPLASQNYVNNPGNPGAPIPGVVRVSLNKAFLTGPVQVNFTRSGSATLGNQYTMNLGTNASSGIVIASNYVIFPPGYAPGSTWSADVQIIPTATPVIGPITVATFTLNGGTTYVATPPVVANVAIANTGPQMLTLSAAAGGTSMNRGIPGDYAMFIITRLGDTNGPSNTPGNVNPTSYTVTNINYYGTAAWPGDFTARAQNLGTAAPDDTKLTIVVNPGAVAFTNIVGNPVPHSDIFAKPVTATVILNLTNQTAVLVGTNLVYTNCVSSEGMSYYIATNAVTMNELDNRLGVENSVLWADPLTSVGASRAWTITYSDAGRGNNAMLPAVIPNYVNGVSEQMYGGTNDFDVQFGYPIANDNVPPSPIMLASNWTTALRMTVNKSSAFNPAGVNALAAGRQFSGNYALRFDMYLSVYANALNNPAASTLGREFATFGVGHYGTNCNWRPASAIQAGAGCAPTNSDGVWFAIDADSGSLTPADFDGFAAPALPHGDAADIQSTPSNTQAGVFKRPPFPYTRTGAGSPINRWVNVSVEVTANTNVNLYIDGNKILTSFANTNGGFCTNGTIMLGYLDPVMDQGDYVSQFVYYSNVRVVELSPYINMQPAPATVLLMKGSTLTLSNSLCLGSAPVTNAWYAGSVTGNALQTNTANASSLSTVLTVPNLSAGNSYLVSVSDTAGNLTSLASAVNVVTPLTNATVNVGAKFTTGLTVTGPAGPTYQWKFNGANLANSTHYAGVTANVLWITNAQAADAGTYSVAVVNAAGTFTPSMVLTVANPPSGILVTPASQNGQWGSSASFSVSANGTAPFTYTWKKNGVNLSDGGNVAGSTNATLTLSPVTGADAATYTVGVTNVAGGALSGNGVLTITVPPPAMSAVSFAAGNAVLSFTSTNSNDTTGAFTLQCSPNVQGPYTNTTGTFSTSGNGLFQVTLPKTADGSMFYRLVHAN